MFLVFSREKELQFLSWKNSQNISEPLREWVLYSLARESVYICVFYPIENLWGFIFYFHLKIDSRMFSNVMKKVGLRITGKGLEQFIMQMFMVTGSGGDSLSCLMCCFSFQNILQKLTCNYDIKRICPFTVQLSELYSVPWGDLNRKKSKGGYVYI